MRPGCVAARRVGCYLSGRGGEVAKELVVVDELTLILVDDRRT